MPYIIAPLWPSLLRISARYAEVTPDDVNREHLVLTTDRCKQSSAKCRRIRIPDRESLLTILAIYYR